MERMERERLLSPDQLKWYILWVHQKLHEHFFPFPNKNVKGPLISHILSYYTHNLYDCHPLVVIFNFLHFFQTILISFPFSFSFFQTPFIFPYSNKALKCQAKVQIYIHRSAIKSGSVFFFLFIFFIFHTSFLL